MEEIKIGNSVRYEIGLDMKQAQVLEFRGGTHVLLRDLETGSEFEAPLEKVRKWPK